MDIQSFATNLQYNEDKVTASVILETPFSKEIRILMKAGQVMNKHQAPYPIIVHVLDGVIDFGVEGKTKQLSQGDAISLDAKVPHDLKANQDSIIRLTLSKLDKVERVEEVASNV